MARINEEVKESLGSATTSAVYKYRKRKGHNILRYSLDDSAGTFSGTIKLQVSDPDENVWVDVPSGSFTAPTSATFVPGGNCDIRWNCSSYSAGAMTVSIR